MLDSSIIQKIEDWHTNYDFDYSCATVNANHVKSVTRYLAGQGIEVDKFKLYEFLDNGKLYNKTREQINTEAVAFLGTRIDKLPDEMLKIGYHNSHMEGPPLERINLSPIASEFEKYFQELNSFLRTIPELTGLPETDKLDKKFILIAFIVNNIHSVSLEKNIWDGRGKSPKNCSFEDYLVTTIGLFKRMPPSCQIEIQNRDEVHKWLLICSHAISDEYYQNIALN